MDRNQSTFWACRVSSDYWYCRPIDHTPGRRDGRRSRLSHWQRMLQMVRQPGVWKRIVAEFMWVASSWLIFSFSKTNWIFAELYHRALVPSIVTAQSVELLIFLHPCHGHFCSCAWLVFVLKPGSLWRFMTGPNHFIFPMMYHNTWFGLCMGTFWNFV